MSALLQATDLRRHYKVRSSEGFFGPKSVLRAVDGANGHEVWTNTDVAARLDAPGRANSLAAKLLALCIADVALMQGDRFGWMVLHENGLRLAEPHRGRGRGFSSV